MDIIDFTWYYIVGSLFVLTVLVYVHEWGHYWVARRNGVRVDVFSIGFGPEIYGWTNAAGTRWKISAIPLGGYVKMFGEEDLLDDNGEEREYSDEEKEVSFHHKTLGQRTAIVVAGPAVNFLFAVALFAGLAMIVGTPTPYAGIGEVMESSAAAEAGLETGDKIISINGQEVEWFEDLRDIVSANPGVAVRIIVLRNGSKMVLQATPDSVTEANEAGEMKTIGRLGVRPDPEQVLYERENPVSAIWLGVTRTVAVTENILAYIGDLIVGNRDTDDLGGPIRIAQISGEMAQAGLPSLFFFMAMLSVNLGLINLFPIPMLDGGHLLFFAAEAIRGRPLGPKTQEYGFRFGLVLVLILVVFVTWNDLVRL
jgi:regulator of sigma E protease